jgi:hypothetical protein
MVIKFTHIYTPFLPSSMFITLYLPYSELKFAIKLEIKLFMCTLTGEVKSVGEIPPPINCAACVEVAVPGPTL